MNFGNFMKTFNGKDLMKNVGMKIAAVRPELLLVGGILSVLGGTIYACTKTDDAKRVLDAHKERTEAIKNTEYEGDEKSVKLQKGRDYTKDYAVLFYHMLRVYGIPALLWFGGMGMIVGAHGELRSINSHLAADIIAVQNAMKEYRGRVATAVGDEVEHKIFMGAQEGKVIVLEKDETTGEEKLIERDADVFHAQPGSIFARNFTNETSDAFDVRTFSDCYLDSRIEGINTRLELGVRRAYTGLEILRELQFNETALGEGEALDALLRNGISGNARKVPDPEMRKLKVTRLRGYQKRYDPERQMDVYVPCLRLDFNFYPLEGKI